MSEGFDLQRFLAREQEAMDAALEAIVVEHVDVLDTPLREPIRYALGTRGKRLRPILCVAAYRAVSGRTDPLPLELYTLACALEIVHTYSLVHDDLPCMDDDDLRRGRPTVHRMHGVPAAILAGAALLPLAVRVVMGAASALGLEEAEGAALAAALCRAAGAEGMVGGQLLDLEGEASAPDAQQLERIHRGKTGALLAASLTTGAAAARASADQVRALGAYGEQIGLAFQIADDVLDVTQNTAALGKTAGRDASLGKSTYPALYGVDGARALANERVADALAALVRGGIRSVELEALARYVVEREV